MVGARLMASREACRKNGLFPAQTDCTRLGQRKRLSLVRRADLFYICSNTPGGDRRLSGSVESVLNADARDGPVAGWRVRSPRPECWERMVARLPRLMPLAAIQAGATTRRIRRQTALQQVENIDSAPENGMPPTFAAHKIWCRRAGKRSPRTAVPGSSRRFDPPANGIARA